MIPRHTMKSVVRQTGLSPHLIRMWERRYQAVLPDRTPSGRRLYTDDDIAKLHLLKLATCKGEAIGQVAQLSAEELNRMLGAPDMPMTESPSTARVPTARAYVEQCLQATRELDALALESILLKASSVMGQQTFLDELVMPFLEKTGELWERGDLKVAQEHLASAVVRSLLGSMAMSRSADSSGPLLLTTTPSGQRHEFGALVAGLVANSTGWRSVHLGPDLPSEEIAAAARDKGARAVVLSLVYPADDPRLGMELRKLRRLLPNDVALLVGGRAAGGYREVLNEIAAILSDGLSDFRQKLNDVRSVSLH